jgi:phage/plasmid-associated DNA primase
MSQELKADTSSIVDSNLLKKLSSAGDSLIGRVHGGLETSFRPHYTLDINCNAMFEVDVRDEALYKRIKVIGYDRQFFLPDQKSDKEIYNEDGSFKKERIRRADDTLKDKLRQKRYLQALVALLIKTFEEWSRSSDKDWVPDEVNIAKVDHFGESNEGSIIDTFLQSYEITNNPDDYVTNEELRGWLEASKINVTLRTLNRDIKYYVDNADFPTNDTVNKLSTLDKKTQRRWLGIRRIFNSDSDSGMGLARMV